MHRFPPLLFLVLTVWSCSNEPTPTINEIDLPYSITDELTTTQITGQIVNYDPAAHPNFIGLGWSTWHGSGIDRENYFLEPGGSFAFTVRDNVVRDYNLQYNNHFFEFAVIPGSDPYLELTPDSTTFTFSAPRDSFVESSNSLIEALANQAFWERSGKIFNYQPNLDTMQREMTLLETDVRQRFDSLWQAGGYTDPVLHEFIRQFVDHRTKRTLPFKVRQLSKEHELQANNEKFLYAELGRELPDMPVYNMMNVNRIQNQASLLSDMLKNRIMAFPREVRKEEGFKLFLATVDSLYTDFSRDMLRTGRLLAYLKLEEPPATAAQLAAEMVQTTPYPALREQLEEQLRVINRVVSPMDAYEQSLLDLPEGLDNLIPAILEKHAGKVVVIDFWATWCSPCIKEMKNDYPRLVREFSEDEVAWVFLARRSSEVNWRDRISKLQFSADHYLTNDDQTAVVNELFGIGSIPHHTLFDQNGTLVKAKTSGRGYGMKLEIEELLGRE